MSYLYSSSVHTFVSTASVSLDGVALISPQVPAKRWAMMERK